MAVQKQAKAREPVLNLFTRHGRAEWLIHLMPGKAELPAYGGNSLKNAYATRLSNTFDEFRRRLEATSNERQKRNYARVCVVSLKKLLDFKPTPQNRQELAVYSAQYARRLLANGEKSLGSKYLFESAEQWRGLSESAEQGAKALRAINSKYAGEAIGDAVLARGRQVLALREIPDMPAAEGRLREAEEALIRLTGSAVELPTSDKMFPLSLRWVKVHRQSQAPTHPELSASIRSWMALLCPPDAKRENTSEVYGGI